ALCGVILRWVANSCDVRRPCRPQGRPDRPALIGRRPGKRQNQGPHRPGRLFTAYNEVLQVSRHRADGLAMAIKVLIADDHSLVRQGLRRYLEMAGDIDVVGEAANGFEVLKLMENGSGNPDIILLDIRMPELAGLQAARS